MKVSLKWLSDYVDVPSDIKEFCDRLDLTGTGRRRRRDARCHLRRCGRGLCGNVRRASLTVIHTHVVTVNVGGEARSMGSAALPISLRVSRSLAHGWRGASGDF